MTKIEFESQLNGLRRQGKIVYAQFMVLFVILILFVITIFLIPNKEIVGQTGIAAVLLMGVIFYLIRSLNEQQEQVRIDLKTLVKRAEEDGIIRVERNW